MSSQFKLMGERRFRQSEILGLARSKPRRAELEARLRHLLIDTGSWRRPEYAEKLRERDRRMHALIAELSELMTERQRAHLQKRIRTFLGDISTLTAST